MSALRVSACRLCGWRGFPERIWCPACGSDELDSVSEDFGVVEDATVLRRAPGRTLGDPVRLGTVGLERGGRVVARLEAGPGERVRLSVAGGAPVARLDA
ncbi:MAG TPA: hypothetical protein VM184_11385 [Gaiellaceae bacterium]|nr:hypothetical protein [Gaiellaceae bacterium]